MKSKPLPYRIIACLLAALVFLSSVGISIDRHYCKGELKTISVFGKAKSCHEIGMGMKNCPHHQKKLADHQTQKEYKNNCCSNKTSFVKSDIDQNIGVAKSAVSFSKNLTAICLYNQYFLNYTQIVTPKLIKFQLSKPPIISRDIYVLLATYLL